jgi:hypothetical protein
MIYAPQSGRQSDRKIVTNNTSSSNTVLPEEQKICEQRLSFKNENNILATAYAAKAYALSVYEEDNEADSCFDKAIATDPTTSMIYYYKALREDR